MTESRRTIQQPLYVTKPTMPDRAMFDAYVDEIWNNQWLTNNGPLHRRFEAQLTERLQVRNACLFSNGHLALETALRALDLPVGGEIITTPFTFASTVHAIVNCGFIPVFCDIEPHTFGLDAQKLEACMTEKTVAIVPVHVFGTPCDIEGISRIADTYRLKVVYDAASAFAVEVNGVGIGNYGDVSMFSMHATKAFHSIEGGVLAFRDKSLKDKLANMRNFGIAGEDSVPYVGTNAKMNEFQAAMGLANLAALTDSISARKQIADTYHSRLKTVPGLHVRADVPGVRHNYAYFPVLVEAGAYGLTRDELYTRLQAHNIFARKYFYPLCTDFACYASYTSTVSVPVARTISQQVLTLPIYATLAIADVHAICDVLEELPR